MSAGSGAGSGGAGGAGGAGGGEPQSSTTDRKSAAAEAQAEAEPSRWSALRRALDALPPSGQELALAAVLGAVALAVCNAVTIAWAAPWPEQGLWLRLQHHGFDLLQVLGLGGWLALMPLAAARWGRGPTWLGWLVGAIGSCAGMYGILDVHLQRQADAVFNGAAAPVVYWAYVLLCGLAVPAAFLVGAWLARVGVAGRVIACLVGLGAMVGHQLLLRDDYPGVHTAVAWASVALLGAALAHGTLAWLEARRRWSRSLAGLASLAALGALLFPPPNATRQALFREPGAVAAWVFAQTTWELPAVKTSSEAALPTAQNWLPEVLARAARGLPRAPVVVLITVDALRADVLASRGDGPRYPSLTALRETGANFSAAVTPGSQTSVSLTSMFSGRYYSQLRWTPHGKGKARFIYAADDASIRFPALLTKAGINTESYLGLVFLAERFGIARGFAHEHLLVKGREHAAAATLMRPLTLRIKKLRRDEAFFGFVHLMEPHEPYDRGRLKEGPPWTRYLSEVEVVDRWLSSLLRLMRTRFRDRGYLIVSADHGEAFGEHGTRFHTKTLYDELLRVPLLVWGPGIVAAKHQQRVSLIDIGPTVLNLFGQAVPSTFMGRSLLPVARGQQSAVPTRPIIAEGRLRRVLYKDNLKVIEDARRKVVEVYDLRADPKESRNLFGLQTDNAEEVASAVAELRAFFAAHTLRANGYSPPYKP